MMNKTKLGNVIASLVLLCAMILSLAGCANNEDDGSGSSDPATFESVDLMRDVTLNSVEALDDLGASNVSATDFALRIFKASNASGENTLISPLSILCALAMTANGAEGETKAQMESVLGMTTEELNMYLYSYLASLPQGEKYKLSVANSIWFKDNEEFTVSADFLQTNADYYGADVYKAPFDEQTLADINSWVNDETDGMIPHVLNEIPEYAIMYLINALAFEAEWASVYYEDQVHNGWFTCEDGSKQIAEMMYSGEHRYLEDENATGFMKYYSGGKYAFVALLPNEGISVDEYIDTLDGEALSSLLSNVDYGVVETAMPKFQTKFDLELSQILMSMGMTDAFDPDVSDFDGIGSFTRGSIYISKVIHKTYIEVGEKGTKAGAVTIVEMDGVSAAPPDEIKRVYLDRPFVYMLIDTENNVPFFIGTMMSVNG
ncbi:MAG: serpin family protein [Clostridia bacterium]|nr:serpin family protein [Clostridia bacterium]